MSLFAMVSGSRADLPRQRFSTNVPDNVPHLSVPMVCNNDNLLLNIFSYLNESDLLTTASSICMRWSKLATDAHASLLLKSVQSIEQYYPSGPLPTLERGWKDVHEQFPWACFLAEGGAKKVYKVFNASTNCHEALSVM